MEDFVSTFRASHRRALGNGEYSVDFIQHFYDVFVSSSDEVQELFRHTDMSAQKAMLHDSLEYMVDFFVARQTNPQIEHIAQIHGPAGRNIPPHLYDLWLDCLVESVRKFDPQFSKSTEIAWRLVLSPGVAYMKFVHARDSESPH